MSMSWGKSVQLDILGLQLVHRELGPVVPKKC
jgi:hypothetical protein